MKLCQYGTTYKNGLDIGLICNVDNKPCCYIRWCNTDKCLKMLSNYGKCKGIKIMSKSEEEKEVKTEEVKIEEVKTDKETKPLKSKPKYRTKKCKVLLHKSKYAIVDFEGFGIRVEGEHDKLSKDIQVKYVGTIGKSTFKVI